MDLLYIILAVAGTIFAGIAIVKYLPLKFQWLVSIVLGVIAIFLVIGIYDGIMAPIKFNAEKKVRYAKVINSLKIIRDAEQAHFEVTGDYSNNFDNLIKFIDTAEFAITQVKNVPKTINLGGGITKEIEERVIDTIGFESVKEKMFAGRDYNNMMNVPGTDVKFELETTKIEKLEGLVVPAFRARVDKAYVLEGLNKDLVRVEKEVLGGDEVKGEYVSVGSLDEVSTAGNWPPSYDKGDRKPTEEE
ncbi:MAG: hypothetical protein ACPGR7_09415 [Flavobacteriaceae bacterium]